MVSVVSKLCYDVLLLVTIIQQYEALRCIFTTYYNKIPKKLIYDSDVAK